MYAASKTCHEVYDQDEMRTMFCVALSDMYRSEVPLYGTLVDIVHNVDCHVVATQASEDGRLYDITERHALERHGAIRLGTDGEMGTVRRLMAVLGMSPVGYYDLTAAGLPLHSTAFRPTNEAALGRNPFRVFTSLLRSDLLPDAVRRLAMKILTNRSLLSPYFLRLLELAENDEKVTRDDQRRLIEESLNIFRWHSRTSVSLADYTQLKQQHPVVADIVCFPSAHVNHLTPRTLDIDLVQQSMREKGLPAKDLIEGPPRRRCNLLLRQTSFRALEEKIEFQGQDGSIISAVHTARFGEVEQRGAAMTRAGRRLYDGFLQGAAEKAYESRSCPSPSLVEKFESLFPDDWSELRSAGLIFVRYFPTQQMLSNAADLENCKISMNELIAAGYVDFEPITYEDFLPLSAAGIFLSNLVISPTAQVTQAIEGHNDSAKKLLEDALGCRMLDEFDLYTAMEDASIKKCKDELRISEIVI